MPTVTVNDTQLYYEVHGTGVPILFLHPPLLTSANFRHQQQQLADSFQVVTVDLRGHGKSAASSVPVTYSVMAEDLRQLLDYLELKQVVLCGYSSGGGIAIEMMVTYPDRFLGAALVSTMPEVADVRLKFWLFTAIGLSSWNWSKRLLALVVSIGNADSWMTFRELLRHSVEGSRANVVQYYRAARHYSCTSEMPRVRKPILLLYGKKDKAFHKYAHELKKCLPNAELAFLEGANHQIPTKNAAEMHRLLRDWMNRHFESPNSVGTVVPELLTRLPEGQEQVPLE